MLVRRFYDDRLAQASYLIGCQESGEAIVIDPARDIAPYLAAAKAEGVRVTRVTETHIHADFVSGARELAAKTGATLLLSGAGGPDWQYRYAAAEKATLLHDGTAIAIGQVRLEVWHTPGHTPEHLAFLVTDTARSDEPVAMVTGDFLFVGDVGRPDLLEKAAGVEGTAEQGARDLYQSLHRLASLPDHLQIWPGHGAGSACGKALGALPSSTLGYERRANWAFAADNEAAFVAEVLTHQPPPPPYFAIMKRTNRDGPALLGEPPLVRHLGVDDVATAMRDGVVVDIRSTTQYAGAHIAGTLNIPLNRSLTKWAGWLLPYDRDLYLVASDAAAVRDVQRALASIGLDRVSGFFGADVIAAAGNALPVHCAPMAEVDALAAAGRHIIDVRDVGEWDRGHHPAGEHHPLGTVATSLASLDRATPLAVHCQGGSRSAIAVSLLERMGFADVINLTGGWGAIGK